MPLYRWQRLSQTRLLRWLERLLGHGRQFVEIGAHGRARIIAWIEPGVVARFLCGPGLPLDWTLGLARRGWCLVRGQLRCDQTGR